MKLYEILVPTIRNDGRPIKTRFHRVWDARVRELTGGITILPKNTSGEWISPDGTLYREQMIPVRIMTNGGTMWEIARMTAKYYEQEAIMYYVISHEVMIYHDKPRNV